MQPEKRPSPDPSLEALEARLHALPRPAAPADLEARLLAAIPADLPMPQRRRPVRIGLAAALAAACLLAVLVWRGRERKNPAPGPEKGVAVQPVIPRPSDDSADIVRWREARRALNAEETPTFTWPLPETVPIRETNSIPSDLLD